MTRTCNSFNKVYRIVKSSVYRHRSRRRKVTNEISFNCKRQKSATKNVIGQWDSASGYRELNCEHDVICIFSYIFTGGPETLVEISEGIIMGYKETRHNNLFVNSISKTDTISNEVCIRHIIRINNRQIIFQLFELVLSISCWFD